MVMLKKYYDEKVSVELKEKFGYKSSMEIPRIEKIILNMGVGEAIDNKKAIAGAVSDMTLISGQKPLQTKAKKSISGFKIREGWVIGCKVTLRRKRLYEFLERLIRITIPRVRDFRGYSKKSFDGHGNYSFGIKEQIIFPEIEYEKVDKIRGLDITIVTSAKTDRESEALLRALDFPIRN